MKAIIYLRTSTAEQNPQNQLKDCKSICKWEYEVVEEKQSAFKDKLDEAVEELRDKIESKLIENALSGDPKHNSCLIFYCKTKMKKRGYIEKSELDISDERTRIIIKEPYDDKRDTLDPKQEASPSIETTEG